MILTKIDDPRDSLDKANRDQLWRFAKSRNVTEIDDSMFNGGYAAERMRKVLRQKGLTDINIPYHQLGLPLQTAIEQPSGNPAMKYEDLINEQLNEMQKLASQPLVRQTLEEMTKPVNSMKMNELRATCKEKGIKMDRTDNLQKLRDKLNGQTTT